MSRKNIPWTDDLLKTLLSVIQSNGAHVAPAKTRLALWEKVNGEFFDQPTVAHIREFYVAKNPRKLRDKFNAVMKANKELMESGNKSAMEGSELTPVFRLTQQIIMEVEEKAEENEEDKIAQAALKKSLETNEDMVLGTLQTSTPSVNSSSKRGRDATDDLLFQYLESKKPKPADSALTEGDAERNMIKHCETKGITMECIITEAKMGAIASATLLDLGIETVINIYCSRGNKFDAKIFKDSMKEMDIPPRDYHVLYKYFEDMRAAAIDEATNFLSPISSGTTATPFSSI